MISSGLTESAPKRSMLQNLESDSEDERQLVDELRDKDRKIAELEAEIRALKLQKYSLAPVLSICPVSGFSIPTSEVRVQSQGFPSTERPTKPLPPLSSSPFNVKTRGRPKAIRRKSVSVGKSSSLLEDLLFSEDTKTNWSHFYSSLKENPNLISQLLDNTKLTTEITKSRPKSTRKIRSRIAKVRRKSIVAANFKFLEQQRPQSLLECNPNTEH